MFILFQIPNFHESYFRLRMFNLIFFIFFFKITRSFYSPNTSSTEKLIENTNIMQKSNSPSILHKGYRIKKMSAQL